MNILKATKRTITSTGQINKLRSDGFIPAILYGGKKNNLNISLKKLKTLLWVMFIPIAYKGL